MSKTLNELFREVILANELENNLDFALRFSDPDGVRSGKSGWSFGVCQFDTQNNDQALACLKECDFSPEEIDGIVKQTIDVKPLAAKLKDHADIVAKYDEAQLSLCIRKAQKFADNYHIPVSDTTALLALADTVNQYGSLGDGSAAYLRKLQHPVTAEDVLNMKLTWKYSQTAKGKADTQRRHGNIIKIMTAV